MQDAICLTFDTRTCVNEIVLRAIVVCLSDLLFGQRLLSNLKQFFNHGKLKVLFVLLILFLCLNLRAIPRFFFYISISHRFGLQL